MFGAEVKRDSYPPGTLYPGQVRIAMRVGGLTVLIAPSHPDEPTAAEPRFDPCKALIGNRTRQLCLADL